MVREFHDNYVMYDVGGLVNGFPRRTGREPRSQGGWSRFITPIEGVAANTPSGSLQLPFGWPDDEELELLRTARFDAPDLPARKAIAEKVQMRALETLPCIPPGQLFQPTAFRSDIRDIVKAEFPLFWGVRHTANLLARAEFVPLS